MSYPEPVYSGSTGKVSATLRPADHEPDLTYPSGNTVHYLATGASTAGKFGLYRWEMGPKPGGAEPHFHKTISESFFLLSGTVRLFNGQKWIDGTAGNFLFVPRAGSTRFATSRAYRPRCSSCSRQARHGRTISRGL